MAGDITTDSLYNGRLLIEQYKTGYRFSIDSVLLAGFVHPCKGAKIVDLGTGCGIIPLLLTFRCPELKKIYGIEIQKQLSRLADLNVKKNNMSGQISILSVDMKNLKLDMISGHADLIVSNPPYHKASSGRINPDKQKAVARHEIKASLKDVIETVNRLLNISGKFFAIYPAERMVDILTMMRECGIEPKYIRMVHSKEKDEARLMLVEGIKGGHPGTKTGPPLIIYQNNNLYTDEINELYSI